MQFVSFDYAWNMIVLVIFGASHNLIWILWMLKNSPSYKFKVLISLGVTTILSLLEIFDFRPIFYLFDPHSMWHFGLMFAAFLYKRLLVADANHYLKSKDK